MLETCPSQSLSALMDAAGPRCMFLLGQDAHARIRQTLVFTAVLYRIYILDVSGKRHAVQASVPNAKCKSSGIYCMLVSFQRAVVDRMIPAVAGDASMHLLHQLEQVLLKSSRQKKLIRQFGTYFPTTSKTTSAVNITKIPPPPCCGWPHEGINGAHGVQ